MSQHHALGMPANSVAANSLNPVDGVISMQKFALDMQEFARSMILRKIEYDRHQALHCDGSLVADEFATLPGGRQTALPENYGICMFSLSMDMEVAMNIQYSTHPRPERPTTRTAFTVLELMVTISIIGILLTLLLPAIGAARESARRVQCVSHLRSLGIALHSHHDAKRSLPVGWQFDPSGQTAFGWVVPLLPYLEQPALFARINAKQSVDHPSHELARNTSLEVMLCPSDITEPRFTLFEETENEEEDHLAAMGSFASSTESTALVRLPTANYVGVFGTMEPDDEVPAPVGDGAFLENRVVRFRNFRRGLSNTIVVGERAMAQVPSTWLGVSLTGEDAAARIVGSTLEGINNPLADECDFSSRHPGGANFLWGDGHVSFVTEDIDLHEYHQSSQLRLSSHR